MVRRIACLLVVVACVACGGAAAPPSAPTGAASSGTSTARAPGSAAATGAPGVARRSASEAMKKAWSIATPKVVAYADFQGLMRTQLMSGLAQGVVALLASTDTTPAQRTCVSDVLANVQELALGTDGDESLVIARVDPAATSWVGRCVLATFPSTKPTSVPGAREAWVNKTDVTAVSPEGLIFLGTRPLVERGLAGKNSGASLASVTLGDGEYVAWNAEVFDNEPPSKGTILATDDRFRIAGEINVPTDKLAQRIDSELSGSSLASQLPSAGLPPDVAQVLQRLVKAFRVKRDGRRVDVSFELREPVVDQARDLGAAATLGIYAVRKYIAKAKEAEARNVVGQLAKDVVTDWEGERPGAPPQAKRKLASYPAVPKAVPKGVKYQSSAADWQPWAPLRFSMETPQYYQYEIKAAKDGESAEILARGDLNGDGKISQFKLLIKVERPSNHLRVSPSIEEIDPDE